jgi:NhaP-type Na+/H+ or K+/H+ antiporter
MPMQHLAGPNPALGFGIALAVGMLAQVLARHLLVPGIVLLLAAGVIVGPDALGLVHPDDLGGAVRIIVNFAVAIILFEGGMHLDIRRLRAEALVIRRLVTIGAVLTSALATVAAKFIMGWDWRLSTLFGTLVIVTGPTVVTPLLRRLHVKQPASTILEAEGVLIDPIGAIIAVVTLELLYFADTSSMSTFAKPAWVLLGGAGIGLVAGLAIGLLLKPRRLVPEGLENVLVLSLVVAVFQLSETFLPESGLTAVVVAGIIVGNMRSRVAQGLLEFKEQLTTMLIGLLFVLLAADVRLAQVVALGWPAIITVAALMFVVRPLVVWICTVNANLSLRERAFIASIAPRGIVAAAVASLFAEVISARGEPGGPELRALVFLVIAVTVTVHGLTGGLIARLLRVRRPAAQGYAILGANPLAFALGRLLREEQPEVVLIDSNPDHVLAAQGMGFRAIYGQGLQNSVLARADLDSRLGCIALTPNAEVNLLWANRVRSETRTPHVWVALHAGPRCLPADSVHEAGATVLFGRGQPIETWAGWIESGEATIERWRFARASADNEVFDEDGVDERDLLLSMTIRRPGRVRPVDDETTFRERDESDVAILESRRAEAEAWLSEQGWVPVDAPKPAVSEPV